MKCIENMMIYSIALEYINKIVLDFLRHLGSIVIKNKKIKREEDD